jgi:hypothetical protein
LYSCTKEIGGYFEFERFYGDEYYNDLLRFDSVRSCLLFIIRKRKYKKIYLPFYLCSSIKDILYSYHILYDFYFIDWEWKPIFDKKLEKDECLFFVNYLGKFSNEELLFYQKKYINIFIDNTQSFFQKPVKDIDTAYSCRKYFGVVDGAYLNTSLDVEDDYNQLPFYISHDKMLHIVGRFEFSASDYYNTFIENEKMQRGFPIKRMSHFSRNTLKGIDYKQIIDKRIRNIIFMENEFADANEIDVKNHAGLFFYPFLVHDGNIIKKMLIKNKIYVPTLWPNVLNDVNTKNLEYYLADNLVFFPIDHRYNIEDMEYAMNIYKKIKLLIRGT